ncbi:Uncharacterised protein [Pragia fontium]|nr:Uncharacterised protein [Pragia fontium]
MRSFGFASNKYKEVDKQYGVGSEFWTHGSAATGLLAGVLGGNVTGGLAAGSAPYMAALVKDATKGNDAARIALHAIVSGALALAQGANPGAAAAGGLVAAASSDVLAQAFYGKPASELVGDEKTLISNLVTMLGSAAGGDGLSIASGGNAARVEVENNALCSTVTCLNNPLDLSKPVMGGMVAAAGGAALGDAISDALKDDDDKAAQPNVGKDLTDAEKAELGGTDSGTPGGWGPQDEENARNNESNKFDQFKKNDLVEAAEKPINNQGMSAAARAWEKHAGRPGGVFEPLKGNPAQKNEAASRFVNEVLNNKGTIKTDLSRGGVEYRLPDGRGIRYNADGSFSGFLDPKRF